MRKSTFLLFALAFPLPVLGQDAPPIDFAASELERSRACVPALERLVEVNNRLEPLARRADRLRALNAAVGLEDELRVEPFDEADPVEEAVRRWFETDKEIAGRRTAANEEEIAHERSEARNEIRSVLGDALLEVSRRSQEIMESGGDIGGAVRDCDGAILVRSAVLEACEGGSTSLVCEDARAEQGTQLRFVDDPSDLWDVEELRPWSDPSRLRRASDGGVAGARTAVLARRGNMVLVMSLEPILLDRSTLSEEEAAEFDENLSALGFTFDDPRFVMAPALGIQFDVRGRPGGETHYLLHFGDLTEPERDVIWSVEASGGPVEAVFPAPADALARLSTGEIVSLTAVVFPEEDLAEGDAIFTLELNQVGQSRAVGALLAYMSGGQLARDLEALFPPEVAGGR